MTTAFDSMQGKLTQTKLSQVTVGSLPSPREYGIGALYVDGSIKYSDGANWLNADGTPYRPNLRLLHDCSSITDVTISGTGATAVLDNTYVRHGLTSIKVTTASSGNTYLQIGIPPFSPSAPRLDGTESDGLGLWVYYPNDVTFTSIIVYLGSERSFGANTWRSSSVGFFEGKYVATSPMVGGWNFINLRKADFNTGTLDLTDITKPITGIQISVINNPGVSFWVDSLWWNTKTTPVFTFTFDDAYETVYNEIFPVFESLSASLGKPIKGTVYQNGTHTDAGTTGYLKADQLQELENAGWVIGNHTYSHLNASSYTTSSLVEDWLGDVARNDEFLGRTSLHKGRKHFAYPNGNSVIGTHDVRLKEMGILSARGINGGALTNALVTGPNYPHFLWAKGVIKSTTANDLITMIDGLFNTLNQRDRWMIGYFHSFGTTAEQDADPNNIVWDRTKMYNPSDYMDPTTVVGKVATEMAAGKLEHKTMVEMEPWIALST